ncbi:MAG: pyroglutamyl-peptidase I family protein [Pseudobdellovibrionaceae bacterium]
MKMLVTGFEAFGGQQVNPSEIIAKEINSKFSQVDSIVLPVSFSKAYTEFQNQWHKSSYDAVLMLGQAAGRRAVSLERVALNWMQSRHLDENGDQVKTGRIDHRGPEAYIVDFFSNQWEEILSQEGETVISLSAGAYVCNSLYFQVIHNLTKLQIPALFVHLPLLPEQTEDLSKPFMDLAIQRQVVFKLMQLMSSIEGE